MPKLLASWWPLIAFVGVVACVVPLVLAVLSVRWDPFGYCNTRAPEGLPLLGEGVGVSWSISYLPVGIECRYGNPVAVTEYHDFGTAVVVVGLLLLAGAVVGAIIRVAAARHDG